MKKPMWFIRLYYKWYHFKMDVYFSLFDMNKHEWLRTFILGPGIGWKNYCWMFEGHRKCPMCPAILKDTVFCSDDCAKLYRGEPF